MTQSTPFASDPLSRLADEPHAETLFSDLLSKEPYPWEPANPDSQDFFLRQEAELSLADIWSDAELTQQSDRFFAGLTHRWQSASDDALVIHLSRRFAGVPAKWLVAITDQAREMANTTLDEIEKLVSCVQPVLNQWALSDLQVVARPVAFAMRAQSTQNDLQKPWDRLSDVEQARLSLQIAHAALAELETQ
ncbi:MAG: hypothetical protein AAGG02_09460 [Cyanobacteria bacterium P01_H01_bin.15]